jgi:hypothetical protein
MPSVPTAVGAGNSDVPVSQHITGLAPGSTYHFRVAAISSAGSTFTADRTLATYRAPVSLPDSRVYEQVSPVDKNGASVQGEPNAVQASIGGESVTFFANSGIPGGTGAQQFPSYLATRSPTDWSTQGLLPPASTGPFGKVLGWSEDLADTYVSNKEIGFPEAAYDRQTVGGGLTPMAEGGEAEREAFTLAAVSGDHGRVLLENKAAQLLPAAAAGRPNVYVWDKASNSLEVASILNSGAAPADGAFAGPYAWTLGESESGGARFGYYTEAEHALSEDGNRVFFTSSGEDKVYMRENPFAAQGPVDGEGKCAPNQALGCTTQISAAQDGLPESNAPAAFVGASVDGRYSFFLSSAKLTTDAKVGGAENSRELYRYDAVTGELEDVAPDPTATNGSEVQGTVGISGDGRTVYFVANANLAPGGSVGSCTGLDRGATGTCSLYMWQEGSPIAFVSSLNARSDYLDWSPSTLHSGGSTISASARMTADGESLVFTASRAVDGGVPQIYMYHRGGGSPLCVSCAPAGAGAGGGASLEGHPENLTGPKLEHAFLTRNLSVGGGRVFFQTDAKLVNGDENGVTDVYEWEADGTGSCTSSEQNGGCVYLISAGRGTAPSYFGDADETGANVFFLTDQPLVAQDRDELVDVYDARVGGGIQSQNEATPAPCGDEGSCRGGALPQPSSPTPRSSTITGSGNVKPVGKCKKGKVRRHGKCVNKPRKQKKHKQGKDRKKGKKAKHHGHKKKHGGAQKGANR